MNFAYIRGNTEDSLEKQKNTLKHCDIDKWVIEGVCSAYSEKPQLRKLLNVVREGDVIFVTEHARLTRNINELHNIVEICEKKKVDIISLAVPDSILPVDNFLSTISNVIEKEYIRSQCGKMKDA